MTRKSIVGACASAVILACSTAASADSGGGLSPIEQLGKELFFDNISDPPWMA